jgi:hypothetical protein
LTRYSLIVDGAVKAILPKSKSESGRRRRMHARRAPEGKAMSSGYDIGLQRTQVSPELCKELDEIVGEDIVLRPEVLQHLVGDTLDVLGVRALAHHTPPFDRPYKCTWYKGRFYCRFYRRGAWFQVWDNAAAASDATDDVVDHCAMRPSITRDEVKEMAARKGVAETRGFYRRDE